MFLYNSQIQRQDLVKKKGNIGIRAVYIAKWFIWKRRNEYIYAGYRENIMLLFEKKKSCFCGRKGSEFIVR